MTTYVLTVEVPCQPQDTVLPEQYILIRVNGNLLRAKVIYITTPMLNLQLD